MELFDNRVNNIINNFYGRNKDAYLFYIDTSRPNKKMIELPKDLNYVEQVSEENLTHEVSKALEQKLLILPLQNVIIIVKEYTIECYVLEDSKKEAEIFASQALATFSEVVIEEATTGDKKRLQKIAIA